MGTESVVGTFILIITGLTTFKGLKDHAFQEHYKFDVDGILIRGQKFRLMSSGFLHANWIHFIFNMLALTSFALGVEKSLGYTNFIVIYFLSMLGGSLLSLLIHRNHGDYSAVGASGAVCGVVASSVILFPYSEIGLILIPIKFTAWWFGLAIIIFSIFGIKSQKDNIGHEAHLGGIIVGILATIIIDPSMLKANWWIALLLLLPIALFFILIYRRPDIMITNKWNLTAPKISRPKKKEKTLDELLDKINRKGVDSLSAKEKQLLEKFRDRM